MTKTKPIRKLKVLHANDPGAAPALWMTGGLIDEDRKRKIQRWHRHLVSKKKQAAHSGEELIATIQDLVADEPATDRRQVIANTLVGLTAAYLLPQMAKLNGTNAADSLEDLLWELSSRARRFPGSASPYLKSLGIELGVALAADQKTISLLKQNFLVEEFESLIETELDSDGWPNGALLFQFGPLAASWTRTAHMLRLLKVELLPDVHLQLEWMVRQCLRMRRRDDSLAFSDPQTTSHCSPFWDALLRISDDPADAKLCRVAAGTRSGKAKKGSLTAHQAAVLAEPFNVCEWGSAAMLRSTWSPKSPKVAIDFSSRLDLAARCYVEVERNGILIAGETMPKVHCGGRLVNGVGGFEVLCDQNDDEIDYLEIQLELSDGGRLNRQFLLSRTDEFLLIGDLIVPGTPGKIDYHGRWPLPANVLPLRETETRELYLQSTKANRTKIQSLVLPLHLPEWRSASSTGSLTIGDDAIELQDSVKAAGLYLPLVFDLNPARSRKMRTWRSLTVAEQRKIVDRDQACGFRFQLDDSQWFFYRAVTSTGNRTYLGENTTAEFACNRLEKDGNVSSMIEVR